MESEQPTEESITKKEVVPNKERPTRRKQRRSGLKNFRRMFQRTGEPMVSSICLTSAVRYRLDYTNI